MASKPVWPESEMGTTKGLGYGPPPSISGLCWDCGGDHMARSCPEREKNQQGKLKKEKEIKEIPVTLIADRLLFRRTTRAAILLVAVLLLLTVA
jgi:hypothetical protein